MNLSDALARRAAEGNPLRVGLIGAGKFGTMFLAQARRTPGLHVLGVADLSPDRARAALTRAGWTEEQMAARYFAAARGSGATCLTDDGMALIAADGLEVVVDATGSPPAGIRFARACCEQGRHLVMVNVEADALAGPLLARWLRQAGLVYSLAYGDQPALICELVDWARACGLTVVAAGKGTKHLPAYHASTPQTVWDHFGYSPETVARGDFNPQRYNSFLDGTKSAIEMAAVANATGLTAAPEGLTFLPCGVDDLSRRLRPRAAGGQLHHAGQVEVVSSLYPDGTPVPRDLRWGVYVVFSSESDYATGCFPQYGLAAEGDGEYAALYRPSHLCGLELGISVAAAGLRGEPTGAPQAFVADVVAVAKRDLRAGETLDGEGGTTVYGRLMPAADSLARGALPVGLADGRRLLRPVAAGEVVHRPDVELGEESEAAQVRAEMERVFNKPLDSRSAPVV